MASLTELRNNRTKLLLDAQKLVSKKDVTKEERTQAHAMLADVELLEQDIAIEERVAKTQAEERSTGRPPRGNPGEQSIANMDEEKRAFRNFIVSGETRDLGTVTTGAMTGGNQLIAPAFYPVLTQAQEAYGGLVNIISSRTTDTGAPMKVSLVNDLANGLLTWPEDTAATEADPVLATTTSTTEMYHTGVITVTIEELQDSFFDLDAFIRDAFGQRLYRGLAKRVSQGSTSGAFADLWTSLPSGATSLAPNAISYPDVAALYGSVDPVYSGANSTWVMNSATRANLIGQILTTGQPLFTVGGTVSGAPVDLLLGRPVVLDQFAPSLGAGNTALAFGDFKAGYVLRNVGQFEIARDPYTYLVSKGAVAFIGYGRGGSFLQDAGSHPIKVLTQHA